MSEKRITYKHPYRSNVKTLHNQGFFEFSVRLLGFGNGWMSVGKFRKYKKGRKVAETTIDKYIEDSGIDVKKYIKEYDFYRRNIKHQTKKEVFEMLGDDCEMLKGEKINKMTWKTVHTHCYICKEPLPPEEIKMQTATHFDCWDKMIKWLRDNPKKTEEDYLSL